MFPSSLAIDNPHTRRPVYVPCRNVSIRRVQRPTDTHIYMYTYILLYICIFIYIFSVVVNIIILIVIIVSECTDGLITRRGTGSYTRVFTSGINPGGLVFYVFFWRANYTNACPTTGR